MYDQMTGTVLTIAFLGIVLIFSRPIWHWIKAGDKPEASATAGRPGRSRWPIVGVLAVIGVLLVALGARSGTKQVTYMVTGSASSINITYTDGSGNTEQQNGLAVPLTTKSVSAGISAGISFASNSGHFAYISAQNQGDSGTLDCAIEADGQVINTGHASGSYAIATCSTFLP